MELRSVDGGMLVQEVDHVTEDPATFTFPTDRKPTDAEMAELEFAWKVCKGVKSNAILVSKDKAGIGMGPGQPNRVDSALLACERAEDFCEREGVEKGGFACASDAFFPFRDNVDVLAAHGVTCIIQPGGSKRDDESIQACNEHGIAMVFTGPGILGTRGFPKHPTLPSNRRLRTFSTRRSSFGAISGTWKTLNGMLFYPIKPIGRLTVSSK